MQVDIKELEKETRKLSILYVEDETDVRKETSVLFSDLFYSITSCKNGFEGLNLYNQKDYDIVISDINMPKLNGIKMCQEMLKINPKQQIIITSAYNDSENLQQLMDIGISNFIHKPMNLDKFISITNKVVNDIKEFKEFNKKDVIDTITGLKNHVAFHKDIKEVKNKSLLIINIKNLTSVQSLYGIQETDSLLKKFAKELTSFIKSDEFLYRNSRGNIAYLFDYKEDLDGFINDLINFLDNTKFNTALGISHENTNILSTANMALEFANEHGLRHKVYSKFIDKTKNYKNAEYYKSIINEALKNDLVYPVFQPIFNTNKEIIKYEVLMRISKIKDGIEHVYYPSQFLNIAMQSDKYIQMSLVLINKTFEVMKNSDKMFSINISYEDIFNEILINEIEQNLKKNKGIGNRFIIEILETKLIEDITLINRFIDKFKAYGVKIALDDFGSGFSNLNHIVSFHCDYVKIDGSLIRNIIKDPKSLSIVKAIITFSKELGIKTIAEYVANKEIFTKLKELGVNEFQGFYLSQPKKDI